MASPQRAESEHERMCLTNPKRECRHNGPGACRRCFERDDSAPGAGRRHEQIPVIGDKKPDGVSCAACHDTGSFFDADGHGGFSWKRPCSYCNGKGGEDA